ncbi:MAG: TonB-dependent receptor plug domain-containing protein [Rubricoccaceae bacterium]
MPRFLVLLSAALALGPAGLAQAPPRAAAPADTARRTLDLVVVTATRDARALADVPVPMTVLPAAQIRAQGAVRLSDLLAEQPGLVLVPTFGGAGVQMQGFDPAYTLILIDGEPVIGREAGTLDLDRLSVGGVERVEIVRGPTSSRYGSDALAGVVNVITRRPGPGLAFEGSVRGGSFGTSELAAESAWGGPAGAARLRLTRYASAGYDLTPDTPGATAPAFADYSAELRAESEPGRRLGGSLTARAAHERVSGSFPLGTRLAEESGTRAEWSLAPRARLRLGPRLHAEASLYGAFFATSSRLDVAGEPDPLDVSDFEQTQAKAEGGLTWLPHVGVALHGGGGYVREGIGGARYAGERASQQGFVYGEAAWQPARVLDVTLSARADAHSDYAGQLSPRVAVLVRPAAALRLRASVGRGFRAPDFRQRYLSFTNAAAGYTVLGSEELRAGLAELDALGGILRYLLPVDALETIRAERSTALNAGLEIGPLRAGGLALTVRANAFHNRVRDLIETQPVAVKTNGQSVFSYFNLARIVTRGLDADAALDVPGGLRLAASVQRLATADADVLDAIAAGTLVVRRDDGREVRLARADYGGLFGRSARSGTLRAEHRADRLGLTTSARLVWRGRYGFADLDGQGVLDRDAEYAPGAASLNVTLTKTLGRASAQLAVTNLLDRVDATFRPQDPGRRILAGLSVRL